jgi:hypothetical protein
MSGSPAGGEPRPYRMRGPVPGRRLGPRRRQVCRTTSLAVASRASRHRPPGVCDILRHFLLGWAATCRMLHPCSYKRAASSAISVSSAESAALASLAAMRARTLARLYLRCPPGVRKGSSRPSRAHHAIIVVRTPNNSATSRGVNNSSSGFTIWGDIGAFS